jgi:hypothetical protein
MEIEQALKVLDQVCSEFKGVRADHIALQQAMDTVSIATAPKPEKVEKEAKPKTEPDGNN